MKNFKTDKNLEDDLNGGQLSNRSRFAQRKYKKKGGLIARMRNDLNQIWKVEFKEEIPVGIRSKSQGFQGG